jgi:putative MATE family efflux protein
MVCLIIIVVMGTFGTIFSRQLMVFAGAQEGTRILEFATDYFRITMIGFAFSSLGMVMNAAQRGSGNTRISMYTNIAANLVNVTFNYLLIGGQFGFPRLEVRGAAIATVMGQIVMFIICVVNVSTGDKFLKLRFREFKPDKEILKSLFNVSFSAFVEQIFMRIGFFTYARLIAGLNTPTVPAIATYTICMNMQNMSFTFGDGLSIASSSLVGRSLGAKRPDMAIVYGKVAQRIALMIASVLLVIFIIGRYFFIGLFTETPKVIEMGVIIVILIAISSPFQLSQVVLSGSLRGAGDTKFVAVVSFISITFVRPVLTWLFCYPLGIGLPGGWISLIIDQGVRLAFSFWRFTKGEWTKKKV